MTPPTPTQAIGSQAIPDVDDIASPCISVCKMDPRLGDAATRTQGGLCVGCLRTIDEIIAWGRADAGTKRSILAAIETRRVAAPVRR